MPTTQPDRDNATNSARFCVPSAITPGRGRSRAHRDHPRSGPVQCLALGRGEQAVVVCERNCSLHPTDSGLRANLALACMIADDMPGAKAEVTRALEMDPTDKVTCGLATMIDDVIGGKRPRLTKYP
jgi:Flp pilus assembly protein TadD